MSTPSTSPLLLADIPGLHDFAISSLGTIVVFTLDKSVAPCPKCDSTKSWLDRKQIHFVEQSIADSNAALLCAVRTHLGLPDGTPVSFPIVFDHNGAYAWNDLHRFKLMELEKQLANADA